MRFLADENFPGAAVAALISAGDDVTWVRIAAPGMADAEVLAWTAREARILLTFDKDFVNWHGDLRCRAKQASYFSASRLRSPGRPDRALSMS
jgi:predicted nuclease of predicted toxin-antitoxin system